MIIFNIVSNVSFSGWNMLLYINDIFKIIKDINCAASQEFLWIEKCSSKLVSSKLFGGYIGATSFLKFMFLLLWKINFPLFEKIARFFVILRKLFFLQMLYLNIIYSILAYKLVSQFSKTSSIEVCEEHYF